MSRMTGAEYEALAELRGRLSEIERGEAKTLTKEEAALALDRIEAHDAERQRLAVFARWIIQEMCFEAGRIDGGDVQDKAVELGLLVEVEGGWDPDKHDTEHWSHDFMEPGDPYFELAPCLKVAAAKPATS